MAMRDRLLGDPERLDAAGLRRGLRFGSSTWRIVAAIVLARRGDREALEALVDDDVPGVRRHAARGLGWLGDPALAARLLSRVAGERTDTVRAALAGAAIRCGADPDHVLALVRDADQRPIGTWYGPRRPEALPRVLADAERAVWHEVGLAEAGPPRARDEVIADGLARLERDPHGAVSRALLPALACQVPEVLASRLAELEHTTGRRSEHAFLDALGWLGDPRARPRLRKALTAMDTDPGRGFAHRRLAALAMGRIGDPALRKDLEAGLTREALDFEGRPGAGLGVQFPVRNVLLWALGEVGDPAAAATLLTYLENTHGSATGGFHLPAMGALAKLGPAIAPEVERRLGGNEILAANAAGVLATLGPSAALERARRDPRPSVRAAASPAPPPEDDLDAEVLEGLRHLLHREYFEAHEALEVAWRRASGTRRTVLQGLIQGAVALEHLRRGNPRGAWGQWGKARPKLLEGGRDAFGVGIAAWIEAMDTFFARIELDDRKRVQKGEAPERTFPPLPDESTWPLPPLDPGLAARLRATGR